MGLVGVVTAIDGTHGRLYVRIDGERWRTPAAHPGRAG